MDNYDRWLEGFNHKLRFYQKKNLTKRIENSFPWEQIKNNGTLKQNIKNILTAKNDMM